VNADAKNISSNCRPQIERVKCCIRNNAYSRGNMFSGDGYIFKTAIKEMRKELVGKFNIEYHRGAASYTITKID
jgi:hypothetical protein